MPGNEKIVEKLVIISGTSGTRLNTIIELIKDIINNNSYKEINRDNTGVYKFEDELTQEKRTGIENIIPFLLESRPAALSEFKQALNNIINDIKKNNYKYVFVAMHLSYLSNGIFIPNPILTDLAKIANETTLIYYVEDYYDALCKMLDYLEQNRHTLPSRFYIDPVLFLEWRGLDHNITMLLSTFSSNIETLIFGIKHPIEEHKRLLHYASLPKHIGRKRYYLVYFSHPITSFTEQYLKYKYKSLNEILGIRKIEETKNALMRYPELIIFDPTTIDELKYEKREKIIEMYHFEKKLLNHGHSKVFSLIITENNRWPISDECLQKEIYKKCRENRLLDDKFQKLFSPQILSQMKADYINYLQASPSYFVDKIMNLVKIQIKMRDYQYVIQSSALFVYLPVFYCIKEENENTTIIKIAIPISKGSEAEVRMANALCKPVHILLEPIEINSKLMKEFENLSGFFTIYEEKYEKGKSELDASTISNLIKEKMEQETPFKPSSSNFYVIDSSEKEKSLEEFVSMLRSYAKEQWFRR